MALAVSNIIHYPSLQISQRNRHLKASASKFPSSFLRFSRTIPSYKRVICAAASAAGYSNSNDDLNPYEVLGVNPIAGFDTVKATYMKKRKEAEKGGDDATAARLEKAYDKIMMAQLTNRKKGVTFGSFQVSKDIKYADRQPIVPWGPRFSKSSVKDIRINLAISAAFTAWVALIGMAEYKPLQFLVFAYVYRIFEKLKALEPTVSPTLTEYGEDNGRTIRMGKRLLRSLALAFGCVAICSLGFTGFLNAMEFLRGSVPAVIILSQEKFITISAAVMLCFLASYYR